MTVQEELVTGWNKVSDRETCYGKIKWSVLNKSEWLKSVTVKILPDHWGAIENRLVVSIYSSVSIHLFFEGIFNLHIKKFEWKCCKIKGKKQSNPQISQKSFYIWRKWKSWCVDRLSLSVIRPTASVDSYWRLLFFPMSSNHKTTVLVGLPRSLSIWTELAFCLILRTFQ